MNSKLFRILCSMTVAAVVAAFTVYADTPEPSYSFLNVTPSSRVYGLGGRNISIVAEDVTLAAQNPALLGGEMDKQLGLNYMSYLGGSNFMGATFALKAHSQGAVALGVQYFGYGDMQAADPDGTLGGKFSAHDISFGAIYSHDITERIRGGISVKGVSSTYEAYSAFALFTDLGLNYYNPDKDMSVSLVISNLGGRLKKFNDESVKMPWNIELGYTQSLKTLPLRLSVTATNLRRWNLPYYDREDIHSTSSALIEKSGFMSNLFRHLVFGVECIPSDRFYIGVGYNYKTRTDMTTFSRNFLSGFSLGAGLNVKMLGFGIALAQPHVGGTTFMFNLNCNIAEFLR